MKTYQPKQKDIKRNWHLIDAKGKVLGRIASQAARFLMGKHKPNYAPHLDMGDYVVMINAEGTILTGRKESQKVYFSHSGYPGGSRQIKFSDLLKKSPSKVIEYAVFGMLPKNRLRDQRLRRLKVFVGENHKYQDKF